MTVTLVASTVDGANNYDMAATSGVIGLDWVVPGTTEHEVVACQGIDSFDIVALASEFSNTDPLAFARVDDIPYVPGTSVEIPIVFGTDRQNVDIVVTGVPGTDFRASGTWRDESFGLWGALSSTSVLDEIDPSGTTNLTYGPFAIGGGSSWLQVMTPPSFSCEIETAWRVAPFDGTPFPVTFGLLAPFAPTPDSNVAIEATGDVGDVLMRWEQEYATQTPAFWDLHEDPLTPYPLPIRPAMPAGLLPDFEWPDASAEIRLVHEDLAGIDDYGHFAREITSESDGRARHRVPQGCF